MPVEDLRVPMKDPQGAASFVHLRQMLLPGAGSDDGSGLSQPGKAGRWILELLCADNAHYLLVILRILIIPDIQACLVPQFPHL